MTFTPKYLNRWTRPDCYFGAEWPEYYGSGCGQSRDSDALERSNFACMLKALGDVPEPADWPHDEAPYTVVRESHWAVGWVEWIAIHQDASAHLAVADKIREGLQDYPVIDELHWSKVEQEDANETWKNCFNPHERVEYIRQASRGEFEFRDYADLRACIRGDYFAGYASELLN